MKLTYFYLIAVISALAANNIQGTCAAPQLGESL
jgi:hypothetical protein